MTNGKRWLACAIAGVACLAAMASISRAADANALLFGIQCQETYANGWQDALPSACDEAEAFSSVMSTIGSRIFYWNMQGGVGPKILEEASDTGLRAEDVDIAYIVGHGGAWSASGASIPGYDENLRAFSKNMRLGNEARMLSVLVLSVCSTGAWWPRLEGNGTTTPSYQVRELLPARWQSAFRGGLRLLLSSWDSAYSSKTNGTKFATYLKGGYTFNEAWRKAGSESNANNDPAVVAV